MTKEELKNAIHNNFIAEYYQSNLCTLADNADYEMCQQGRINIEDAAYELIDELADIVIETMEENNVLIAKKARV